MNVPKWIAPLFFLSALYDGVLGILFLFAPGAAFDWFDIVPPNHPGYVQFPAALLLIFALIFLRIARDPVANRVARGARPGTTRVAPHQGVQAADAGCPGRR